MQIETVRVMPWSESQGEFVVINAVDFDPAVHKLHEPDAAAKAEAEAAGGDPLPL